MNIKPTSGKLAMIDDMRKLLAEIDPAATIDEGIHDELFVTFSSEETAEKFKAAVEAEKLKVVEAAMANCLQAWCKKRGYPAPTPLEEAYASHRRNIEHARRQLEELEARDPAYGYTPVPDGEAP